MEIECRRAPGEIVLVHGTIQQESAEVSRLQQAAYTLRIRRLDVVSAI